MKAFKTKNGEICVEMTYNETCSNVHHSCNIYQDGAKKTITVIKNLLK